MKLSKGLLVLSISAFLALTSCGKSSASSESTITNPGADTSVTVPEHNYGAPVYVWAEDNASCAATASCQDDGCDEVITETAMATIVTNEPSCGVEGSIVATATFENPLFETQSKTTAILDPLEHNYRDVIDDEGNFVNKCVNCGDVKETSAAHEFSGGEVELREFENKEHVKYAEMVVKTDSSYESGDVYNVAGFTFHCEDTNFGDVLTFGIFGVNGQYWIGWSVLGDANNFSGLPWAIDTTLPESGVKIVLKIEENGSADGYYDLFDGNGLRYLESQMYQADTMPYYAWGDAYFNAKYIDGIGVEKGATISDVKVNSDERVSSSVTFTAGDKGATQYKQITQTTDVKYLEMVVGAPTAGQEPVEGKTYTGIITHNVKGDFTENICYGVFYLFGQYWIGWTVLNDAATFGGACRSFGSAYPTGAIISVTFDEDAASGFNEYDGMTYRSESPVNAWGQTSTFISSIYSNVSCENTGIKTDLSQTTEWLEGPGTDVLSDGSVRFNTIYNSFSEYSKELSVAGEGFEVSAKVTVPNYSVTQNSISGFSVSLGTNYFLNYYVEHTTWSPNASIPVLNGSLNYGLYSPSQETGLPNGNMYWYDANTNIAYTLDDGDLVYWVKFICSEEFGLIIKASTDGVDYKTLVVFPYSQVVSPNRYARDAGFSQYDMTTGPKAKLYIHQYDQHVAGTVYSDIKVTQGENIEQPEIVTEFDTSKVANVILMGGQSNMEGTDAIYGDIPAETRAQYKEGHDNVLIDHYCRAGRNFSNGFVPVNFGQGFSKGNLGPEVGFAKYLGEHSADENYYLIKSAYGGTNLYNDWSSNGTHYMNFVNDATEAIQILVDAGLEVHVIGMLWMQGEADAGNISTANNYAANLASLIDRVQLDFVEYLDDEFTFTASFIQTDTVWTYSEIVNNAIASVCDSYTEVGASLDLCNPYHYTADAYLKLGEGFGEAFLDARE